MSWGGITVFWLRQGQEAAEAVIEMLGGCYVEEEFIPTPSPPPAPEQLRASQAAEQVLRQDEGMEPAEPGLHERAVLVDGWNEIILCASHATVLVSPDRAAGTFEHMWRRVQRLAAVAPAVVYDLDADEFIDISPAIDDARRKYDWCD